MFYLQEQKRKIQDLDLPAGAAFGGSVMLKSGLDADSSERILHCCI